jgi:hypothetical protein
MTMPISQNYPSAASRAACADLISSPRRPIKICILNEDDARSFVHGGIEHKCSSRRHHHYSRAKADALVRAGELTWLGKHKRIATYTNARTWMKVYTRTPLGAALYCGMQMVRGGGGY